MFRLKLQYLLAIAVNGCLIPFIPLYLQQLGLSDPQISNVMAVSGLAVILSPVLATLIADAHLDARHVLGSLLILASICLVGIPLLHGYMAIVAGFLAFNILFMPVMPLQDGMNLAMQEYQRRLGLKPIGYHKIRVWGTIGFLVPGLLLYLLVKQWSIVTVVLYVAGGFAMLAGINAMLLPRTIRDQDVLARKLPTAEAARALFGGRMLIFCVASFLLHMASQSYYTFYPIYLFQKAGIPRANAGMIMNIGVIIEIPCMLAFGRMLGKLGPRRFLLMACVLMAIRMALLGAFPTPAVAIGIQALHGMMVLLLQVAPVVLIDRLADDRFRNSIQGLYVMVVIGGGRIVGNLAAGQIADRGYQLVYWWATGLVLVATLLLMIGYHPRQKRPSGVPNIPGGIKDPK